MDEKIQKEILAELKNISTQLSVRTTPQHKQGEPYFGQTIYDAIVIIEDNINKVFTELSRIKELLQK
jgi:hypothetical protein